MSCTMKSLFKMAIGTCLPLEDGQFRILEEFKWSFSNSTWRKNSILILLFLMSWQVQLLVSNKVKNLKSKVAQKDEGLEK